MEQFACNVHRPCLRLFQLEESPEKKVLVLGLEHSGKSTLVSQIVKEVGQKSFVSSTLYKPTEGFNVTSLSDGTSPTVNIWESKRTSFMPHDRRSLIFPKAVCYKVVIVVVVVKYTITNQHSYKVVN